MRKTEEIKQEAFRLYSLGLTSVEIGKLLDVSHRTVQNYMTKEGWKDRRRQIRAKRERQIFRRLSKLEKVP